MENSSKVPKRRGRPVGGGGSVGSRKKTKGGSRKVIEEEAAANPLESMQGGDSVAMEQKVLEVASGCDVIAAVYDFAKRYQVDLTIISAYGMVTNITIFQPPPFPTFSVRRFNSVYDLVSIKGSFCGSVDSTRPPPPPFHHLVVSFTSFERDYHTGIIQGGITAVSSVVLGVSLIRGSTCSIKLPLPPPRVLSAPQPLFPAQNEDMPTETFGLDEIFLGTGRSMTAFSVPSVASPANLNVWKSPAKASGSSSTSFFK